MKFLNIAELAALTNCMNGRTVGDMVLDGRLEVYSCKATEADKRLERDLDARYGPQQRHASGDGGPSSSLDGATSQPSISSNALPGLSAVLAGRRSRSNSFVTQPTAAASSNANAGPVITNGGGSSAKAPFGDLADPKNRTVFAHLLETLNSSFPDFDFTSLPPEQFERLSGGPGGALQRVAGAVNGQLRELAEEEARRPQLLEELRLLLEQADSTEAAAASAAAGTQAPGGAKHAHGTATAGTPAGRGGRGGARGGRPPITSRTVDVAPATSSIASSSAGGGGGGSGSAHGGDSGSTPGKLRSLLTSLSSRARLDFLDVLWAIVDDCMQLTTPDGGSLNPDVSIFSYVPRWDTDPLTAGALWSFNFLFYNRALRKVLFFAVVARSTMSSMSLVSGPSARGVAFSPSPPATARPAAGEGGGGSGDTSPRSNFGGSDALASSGGTSAAGSPSHAAAARRRAPAGSDATAPSGTVAANASAIAAALTNYREGHAGNRGSAFSSARKPAHPGGISSGSGAAAGSGGEPAAGSLSGSKRSRAGSVAGRGGAGTDDDAVALLTGQQVLALGAASSSSLPGLLEEADDEDDDANGGGGTNAGDGGPYASDEGEGAGAPGRGGHRGRRRRKALRAGAASGASDDDADGQSDFSVDEDDEEEEEEEEEGGLGSAKSQASPLAFARAYREPQPAQGARAAGTALLAASDAVAAAPSPVRASGAAGSADSVAAFGSSSGASVDSGLLAGQTSPMHPPPKARRKPLIPPSAGGGSKNSNSEQAKGTQKSKK